MPGQQTLECQLEAIIRGRIVVGLGRVAFAIGKAGIDKPAMRQLNRRADHIENRSGNYVFAPGTKFGECLSVRLKVLASRIKRIVSGNKYDCRTDLITGAHALIWRDAVFLTSLNEKQIVEIQPLGRTEVYLHQSTIALFSCCQLRVKRYKSIRRS